MTQPRMSQQRAFARAATKQSLTDASLARALQVQEKTRQLRDHLALVIPTARRRETREELQRLHAEACDRLERMGAEIEASLGELQAIHDLEAREARHAA